MLIILGLFLLALILACTGYAGALLDKKLKVRPSTAWWVQWLEHEGLNSSIYIGLLIALVATLGFIGVRLYFDQLYVDTITIFLVITIFVLNFALAGLVQKYVEETILNNSN